MCFLIFYFLFFICFDSSRNFRRCFYIFRDCSENIYFGVEGNNSFQEFILANFEEVENKCILRKLKREQAGPEE